jgi:hypothetical protein
MDAGLIERGDPALTSQMIWASVHGWVSIELNGMGFVEDAEAGAERLCAVVAAGLRPRAG